MIRVHKMNGTEILLNADWIETIEATPDTVITLMNGHKYVVKDTMEEVVEAYKEYRRQGRTLQALPGGKKWSSTGLD